MTKQLFLLIKILFITLFQISANQQSSAADSLRANADSLAMYQTQNLIIQKLSNHIYSHISFLKTNDFGTVGCNGMIVVNKKKAIIFDTPSNNQGSAELINYLSNTLNCKIIAIIPTHFHNDCVGGMEKFNEFKVPAYASAKTIELLNKNGTKFSKPLNTFNDKFSIKIGNKKVYAEYFGEGHTRDNIIGYFPEDNAIFGGCLVKESGASKGFLGDANTNAWSETVHKIKEAYPGAKIVIPGHGKWGGTELFDYTIELFDVSKNH
jgi:metallo-beta-lactamase class B